MWLGDDLIKSDIQLPPEVPINYNREQDGSGLSKGAIAGIVIACVAMAVIVGVLTVLIKKGHLFGKKKIILDNSNSSYNNISYSQVNYNNKI